MDKEDTVNTHTHTMTTTQPQEKHETLPFATTGWTLKALLSEIKQRQTSSIYSNLYVESIKKNWKKTKTQAHRNRTDWSLSGVDEMHEAGEKLQTFF